MRAGARVAKIMAPLVLALATLLALSACKDASTEGAVGEATRVDGVDPSSLEPSGGAEPSGESPQPEGEAEAPATPDADPGAEAEGSTDDTSEPEGTPGPGGEPDTGPGPEPDPGGTKEFGEPCSSPGECASGYCVDGPDGTVCSMTCTEACPLGWACQELSQAGDPVFICVSLIAHLCHPCTDSGQCNQGEAEVHRCLESPEGGSFCAIGCALDGWCPDGYSCVEDAGGEGDPQCLPASGECTCNKTAIKQGLSTPCATTNVHGTCTGERVCGSEGLSACSAQSPALEACNGFDDNCDGDVDEGLVGEACLLENEFGVCMAETACVDGESVCVGDEPLEELCDGLDQNCDGVADEGFPDFDDDSEADCVDTDDDDDGDADLVDCAPLDPSIGPSALEICNQQDEDCDGLADEPGAVGCDDFWRDVDQDSWGSPKAPSQCLCAPAPALFYTAQKPGDCDDLDPAIFPGATEVCNTKDDDCDGTIDEGTDLDFDKDGLLDCNDDDDDNDGWKDVSDCEPFDPTIHPGSDELCDELDNDCDGVVDGPGAAGCEPYLLDLDGDGYGAEGAEPVCLCEPSEAMFLTAEEGGDCDDVTPSIFPAALEQCNDLDDDCDGEVDEGVGGDFDGDGEGDCTDPDDDNDGVLDAVDCQPYDSNIFPGATELCNGFDDDCDGVKDEENAVGCKPFWVDADGDGWGLQPPDPRCLCAPDPLGLWSAETPGDCDDTNATTYPLAPEICNSIDDDCDGQVDEGITSPCGGCEPTCAMEVSDDGQAPFEPDPDSDGGVETTEDGGLTLTAQSFSFPFIWIANSAEATVSRLNTETGCEVARYALCANPSRTAVDLDGNGIVACRDDGGVAKVSVLEALCPDSNGNGVVDTSHDLDGDCQITANEMVAGDECVLWLSHPDGEGGIGKACKGPLGCARAAGVDDGNNVWVGMWNSSRLAQLDGETGEPIVSMPITGRPYGLAIDADRNIWVASRAPQILIKVDPFIGELGWWPHPSGKVYGIAIDGLGKVWVAGGEARTVARFDPDTEAWTTLGPLDVGFSRGVAARVNFNNDGTVQSSHVYVGHHSWSSGCAANGEHRTVSVINALTMQQQPSVDLGADRAPVGVAVDHQGMLWSVNQCESSATRLNPDTGQILGTWPVGLSPYSYSDMTGYALKTITTSQGFYHQVFQGWTGLGTLWDEVWISGDFPGEGVTWAMLEARTATTEAALEAAPWQGPWGPFPPETYPVKLGLTGELLELKLTLGTEDNELKPTVSSMHVIAHEITP